MNQQADDNENLSPKAAAFSIASLLTKDLHENSITSKTSEHNPPLMDHKEKANRWNGCQNDLPTHKAKLCVLPREVCEDYSVQNILNAEYPRGDKCADGIKRETGKSSSNFDPLQQFASCCDLVRNLDSLNSPSSLFPPQIRLLDAQREVQVAMQQSDLWWKFYACGTEMVITRTGR